MLTKNLYLSLKKYETYYSTVFKLSVTPGSIWQLSKKYIIVVRTWNEINSQYSNNKTHDEQNRYFSKIFDD